ncbi:MAG: LON peptidase substrate-binding domain-containing protein, partial [Anaerolineales bacterium]
MPASRWNSNILDEILAWIDEDEFSIADLILNPIVTRVADQDDKEDNPGEEAKSEEGTVPSELPVLPLRGLVVYPETAVPLTIGQPRSIRLIDDVIAQDNRMIGLVASQNPDLESPNPEDLYQIGTVSMVHRMFRAPDGTIRLLVQGLHRFKVGEFTATDPYLKA